ncbi:MAG: hypothetical protein ACPL1B_10285, partial [Thermoprotei archaeon]
MKGRLLGLAVLATATMANAAAQLDAGNKTVAEELTAGGYVTTNLTNKYKIDDPISVSSGNAAIKLTLNGARFAASKDTKIFLCQGTTKVGSGKVPEARNNVSINIKSDLNTTNTYYFATPAEGRDDCTDATNIQYSLNNLIEGQKVTLTITGIGNAAVIADAVATVATIKKQFTAKVDPTTAKIDLKTFKNFVTGGLVTSNTMKAGFKIISDENIDKRYTLTGGGNNACNYQLDQNALAVDFTLKGKLQEYSTIEILNTKDTVMQYKISADDRNNGQVTISNFNLGSGAIVCNNPSATPAYIQLKVDGQTQIQEDTKKLTITLKKDSYSRNLITDADAFIVKLDAKTLYIPLVGVNPATGRETYIKLQMSNNTVKSANVTFFILADDGSIAATYNKTLTAGTTLSVTGSELKDAAIKQGKTISGDSFAVKIIITAPVSDIFAYANMVDPNGAKRVPVKV